MKNIKLKENSEVVSSISRIFEIFKDSGGEIRPHFILTGPSGSGKSHSVHSLADKHSIDYLEINAAQLTKEGKPGNSLSKVLKPLENAQNSLSICFVDEFDKLFVAGNDNESSTFGDTSEVQNEFLKIIEAQTTSVFGDYGKYVNIKVSNVLFVFAGAFNGESDITHNRLRELGLKTEFIGRVGIILNTAKLSLETLYDVLDNSELLDRYVKLYSSVSRNDAVLAIREFLAVNNKHNDIGIRMINMLIHQYFINGKFTPLHSRGRRR